MAFTKPLPEWNKQGTEPPSSLKTSGWEANQKPPADYFNWLQYTAYQALQELQQKAADKNEITVQDGTTSQKGIVQLEDSTSSTSTTKAATPNSVKAVNDALTTHQNDEAIHKTSQTIRTESTTAFRTEVVNSLPQTAEKGRIVFLDDANEPNFKGYNGGEWV